MSRGNPPYRVPKWIYDLAELERNRAREQGYYLTQAQAIDKVYRRLQKNATKTLKL